MERRIWIYEHEYDDQLKPGDLIIDGETRDDHGQFKAWIIKTAVPFEEPVTYSDGSTAIDCKTEYIVNPYTNGDVLIVEMGDA